MTHPLVIIDEMSNDPFPVELEQIARRLAITPSLSQHDRRIVIDSLRRLAGARDGQAAVAAGEGRQHPLGRSLLALPADYGLLCALFAVMGWPEVFRPAYVLLLAGFAAITAAS